MAFRSHLLRAFDLSLWSNRAMFALLGTSAVAGLVGSVFFDAPTWTALEVPATFGVVWALGRELDPDRDLTALIAGSAATFWAISSEPNEFLFVGGLAIGARLVLESTGRRPLRTDLVVVAVGAALISFTPLGFVAGFGLAIAIYTDNHLSAEPSRDGFLASVLAAAATAVVASVSGAFPSSLPDVEALLVVSAGGMALLAVVREPPAPVSQVDSRKKTFLRQDRLQIARVLVAILVLTGTLLAGPDAGAVTPVVTTLAIALASSEIERLVRSRL